MFISLQELEIHPIVVSKVYPSGELDYHGGEFRQLGQLKVDAVAELVGAEVRIRGHIQAHLEASCDRCLVPVEIPIEHDFDIFYRPLETIAREEEIEIPEDESEIGFFSGGRITLADVVMEQVILSLPMKIVCRPDCLGLCPVCRVNRNLEVCHCEERTSHSPFASLLGE